jgi:hypothetical protein
VSPIAFRIDHGKRTAVVLHDVNMNTTTDTSMRALLLKSCVHKKTVRHIAQLLLSEIARYLKSIVSILELIKVLCNQLVDHMMMSY